MRKSGVWARMGGKVTGWGEREREKRRAAYERPLKPVPHPLQSPQLMVEFAPAGSCDAMSKHCEPDAEAAAAAAVRTPGVVPTTVWLLLAMWLLVTRRGVAKVTRPSAVRASWATV